MLLQMANFHSFIWLNTIPLYIRYILFIQSSVNGHLCCSQALAIVSSAVMNTGVHVSFQVSHLGFLEKHKWVCFERWTKQLCRICSDYKKRLTDTLEWVDAVTNSNFHVPVFIAATESCTHSNWNKMFTFYQCFIFN